VFSARLLREHILDERELAEVFADAKREVRKAVAEVLESPTPAPATARTHVFSGEMTANVAPEEPEETKKLSFIQAVNEALSAELRTRSNVLVYGEDVGFAGGIFGASKGLQQKYGEHRVFDTPISEAAILGSAVGAALTGMKPIVEIMWADFMLVALDQIINQAANVHYITAGRSSAPVVIRTQQGVTPGSCAQHSQSLEALLAHIPGLRLAIPSNPQDAYSILRSAASSQDPCVIFEARSLYATSGDVTTGGPIEPIGKARRIKDGKDAVIITWGTMVRTTMEAADLLQAYGTDVGILDLRWLCPLDEAAIMAAVERARGRVVIVHEANITGGFGAEIASRLHESLASRIELHIARIGAPDVRIPASPVLQAELIPSVNRIAEAVRRVMEFSAAHRQSRPVMIGG
jgi:2-oxoisovalerate dehydrogenase E1 component